MELEGKKKRLEKEHDLWRKKKWNEFTEWQIAHPGRKNDKSTENTNRS